MKVESDPDPKRSYDAEPAPKRVTTEEAAVRAQRSKKQAYPVRPGR